VNVKLTPEGQTLALRAVLAAARLDNEAWKLVLREMSRRDPVDMISEVICVAVHFATALHALGYEQKFNDPDFRDFNRDGHAGAVEVIEQWMQSVLDEHDVRPG
jgi:hypothetical protein